MAFQPEAAQVDDFAASDHPGAGPEPCPIARLTTETLAAKFGELTSDGVLAAARALGAKMAREDGVARGLDHFLSSLPRHKLLCDVHLLLEPPEARRQPCRHRP